jgi:hypothetical protein
VAQAECDGCLLDRMGTLVPCTAAATHNTAGSGAGPSDTARNAGQCMRQNTRDARGAGTAVRVTVTTTSATRKPVAGPPSGSSACPQAAHRAVRVRQALKNGLQVLHMPRDVVLVLTLGAQGLSAQQEQ